MTPRVLIVGAGFAGICMAIRLKQAGIESFTILEKSERVGGTWRENTYPGSGCDVPSHLYCYSFEPNPNWSRKYSGQAEIQAYLEHCVAKWELTPHVRFGSEVASLRFDEAACVWRVRVRSGEELSAQVLVTALGQLGRPALPDIPGLERFEGDVFHSARWDHRKDLGGRRVAVVGSGASAIQIVPEVAKVAAELSVFQRSPAWILPRGDRGYSAAEKWLFRVAPPVQRAYRSSIYLGLEARFFALSKQSRLSRVFEKIATLHLESQVADPSLRRRLTPDYPLGCKRILISDDYYPAVVRSNVEVVAEPIARIGADSVVTEDGAARPCDTLVLATGFETTAFLAPLEVSGRGGQTLSGAWRDGAAAYLGLCVSGFPNLFMLYGPNTNLGHNSIVFMIECQVGYVMRCIRQLSEANVSFLDVRADAMRRFNEELQLDLERRVWDSDCTSWYKTASGRNTNNWSGFTLEYWWRTRRPDFRVFETR